MELKDQILQTKERKQGFLKSMPQGTRTQINTYQKMEKIKKYFWVILAGVCLLALISYLVSCLAVTGHPESRWIVNLIIALVWIAVGACGALYQKSLAEKAMKAITLGAQDYVDELNVINARLAGLEKAERERQEAERQEAKAKARAEAAQRDAEAALQRQQAVLQANSAQPKPAEPVEVPVPAQPQNPKIDEL